MSIYIKNWSIADWKELLKWAKIGANNAMIGEFAEVEELPPHGKLIDTDELTALVYAKIALFDSAPGRMGAEQKSVRALLASMVDDIENAPTIIPAEEGE